MHEVADQPGWVRVRVQAERLDWIPAMLVGLGLPFVVEQPEALRHLVRALADRLVAAAAPAGLQAPRRSGSDDGPVDAGTG